jgi:hypothetical protein
VVVASRVTSQKEVISVQVSTLTFHVRSVADAMRLSTQAISERRWVEVEPWSDGYLGVTIRRDADAVVGLERRAGVDVVGVRGTSREFARGDVSGSETAACLIAFRGRRHFTLRPSLTRPADESDAAPE